MSTNITANEMVESLTGFEEIAIANQFGAEITELFEKRPMGAVRALVFVDMTRSGLTTPDAKRAALELTIKQVTGYFLAEEDEPMPDDPVTESGKDAAQLA